MNSSNGRLTIGKLAQAAGVGIDTVRFYERAGLMPAAMRTASGYRTYDRDGLARLRFIRRAKALGFALDEVAELLRLGDARGSRAAVKAVTERRLRDLDARIRELTVLRDTLAQYARQCSGDGPVAGCPIIEAVLAPSPSESTSCNLHGPTSTHAQPSRTLRTTPTPTTRSTGTTGATAPRHRAPASRRRPRSTA